MLHPVLVGEAAGLDGKKRQASDGFSDPDLEDIWKEILRPGAAEDESFVAKYYHWNRPVSVPGLLFGGSRIWLSWGYKTAYPKLANFLDNASLDSKLRSQVILEEIETNKGRSQRRKFRYNEAHAPIAAIFDALKAFPTAVGDVEHLAKNIKNTALTKGVVRILHITDISPLVLSCIFGTTSSFDISHIAAFVERHLNRSNWAKANLLSIRRLGWSSFIYEYHFSFYYVTLDYFESDLIKPDPRKIRKSCSFGKAKNSKHRYIHEETISFLLCGHFDNVFCCYQLADAYFKPRYAKDTGPRVFRSYDPNQSPGQLLLYWIAVALFHARSRWENAIECLDSEIISPSDVVFMEDRNDLMADDPQFSLSKTYFWALQTYKLFELGLERTIATWENFKIHSLPKVRDGRISREDWDAGVESIDQAIEHLKLKIIRVRRGIQDVKDLREGLQSTATIFDSRTSVRQGENIRLLTYITLLFLPLSFGTSIFGMQIIEQTPTTIKAFAITLPSITIATALIIFNLNTIMTALGSLARKTTSGLQRKMRAHYRRDWKDRAFALHQDHLTTEPPARRAAKQSSHWVYILFLIEAIVVVLPVSELDNALHCYGIFHSRDEGNYDNPDLEQSDVEAESRKKRREVQNRVKRTALLAKEKEQRRRNKERGAFVSFFSHLYWHSIQVGHALLTSLNLVRLLLCPAWISILVIEYVLLLVALGVINGLSPGVDSTSQRVETPSFRARHMLGLDTITFPKWRYHGYPLKPSNTSTQGSLKKKRFRIGGRHKGEAQAVGTRSNNAASLQPNSSNLTPVSPVAKVNELVDPVYSSGLHEMSTFAEMPSSLTATRVRRAVHYATAGGGHIPGDFNRAEISAEPGPTLLDPELGSA